MVRLFKRAAVILGICAAIALANSSPNHNGQLKSQEPIDVVLDSQPSDMICRDGRCYPRVFVPTHDFEEILEGQEIPPGLHVRMDFETHRKFAKLMDPKAQVDESDPRNAVVVVDTDKTGTQHHDVSDSLKQAYDARLEEKERQGSPPPTILNNMPEFHKPNPHLTLDDHAAFTEHLEIIESPESSLLQVESALEGLGELVSEMDFGLRLAQGSGLHSVMQLLVCHPDTAARGLCDRERTLRSNAALVVGNAVQNHPAVQKAAIQLDLHRHLLSLMETESDPLVARRLVTAFGNLVRGNQNILTNGDIVTLAIAFENSTDATFRRKCAIFMTDFADPDMRMAVTTEETQKEQQEQQHPGEQQAPFSSQQEQPSPVPSWIPPEEVERTPEIVEPLGVNVGPWCDALQESLMFKHKDSTGAREAIEGAVKMLTKTFPDSCTAAPIRHNEL